MDCPTCIPALEKAVTRLQGVTDAKGSYFTKTMKVSYYPDKVGLGEIEKAIEDLGYRIAYKEYPGLLEKIKDLFYREDSLGVAMITDGEFEGKVLLSDKIVVILFSSETCPSCTVFKPGYYEMAKKHDKAEFYEMDIGNTETWKKYDIFNIPQVLVFEAGSVKNRFAATIRTDDIERIL
jgi:copper chaperone CopZ